MDKATAADFGAVCHDLRQFVIAGRLLADVKDEQDLSEDLRERLTLLRENFDQAGALLDDFLSRRQRRVVDDRPAGHPS